MASTPKWFNAVGETSTTTGTGTYTIGGAFVGARTFVSKLADGESFFYRAEAVDGSGNPTGDFEIARGTLGGSGTTISRDGDFDTWVSGSNGSTAVSWAAGTRRIHLIVPAIYTPPTDGVLGAILKGVKYVDAMVQVNTGDTDLYTCPSGKRAFVAGANLYNTSGGSITAFWEIKHSGTYYRINSNTTITTLASGTANNPGVLLEAGDIFAVNTATNNGMNCAFNIVEFDADSPLKSASLFGLSSGDNTLYTCPNVTGKTAVLVALDALFGFATAGSVFFVADGTGRTVFYHIVQGGGSPGASNRLFAGISVSANTRTQSLLRGCLDPTDFVNINVDVGNAAQFAQIYVLER